MNLGAGRVVYQNLVKLNMAVENATLGKENAITKAFEYALENKKNVHFIGLVSDGGVHSHINHLKGLLTAAHEFGLNDQVYVHAFSDGRDCDPHSGKGFIKSAQTQCEELLDKFKKELQAGSPQGKIILRVHPNIFKIITNVEYNAILVLEKEFGCEITLVSDSSFAIDQYKIEWA